MLTGTRVGTEKGHEAKHLEGQSSCNLMGLEKMELVVVKHQEDLVEADFEIEQPEQTCQILRTLAH
ncbi:hypothetical protein Leryth_014404 [Lithospermum erythrorhizon]|nr:hypothetical protein Leryth_014404 [Lithospermum erythrorhizon]